MAVSYHFSSLKTSQNVRERMESQAAPGSAYRGRLHPSGRLTIGYIPKKKISVNDKRYEAERGEQTYYCREHWHYREGLVREVLLREEKPQSLGLSSVSFHHKDETKRHGLRGITRRGRHRILECTNLLERRYGKRLGFYTLTCPYTDPEMVYEFNKCFSEVLRRYFQELRREYARYNLKFAYTAVYEVQPQRFHDSGVFALHCHYVSPCYFPGTRTFVISADSLRAIWGRVVRGVVGGRVSVDASIDAQVVKKSASGYLAKYLSKGYKDISMVADVAPSQIPRRWWSVSKNLLKCLQKLTIELSAADCGELVGIATSTVLDCSLFYYCKIITCPSPMGDRIVGYAMAVKPELADALRPYEIFAHLDEEL